MYKFYIPGFYTVYSRLNRWPDFLSWLLVLPGIVFLMNYLWFSEGFISFIILFACYFFSWLSIYELGYIENDTFTISREENPTRRIAPGEIDFVKRNSKAITTARTLLFLCFLVGLSQLIEIEYLLGYSGIVMLSFLIFKAHNKIRSKINILTYFGLSVTKYLAFSSLFIPVEALGSYTSYWMLLFPIPRTLEHATKIKYQLTGLQRWIGNHDKFRVKYYSTVFLFAVGGYLYGLKNEAFKIFILGVGIFLFYRLLALGLLKYTALDRSRRPAHKWEDQ